MCCRIRWAVLGLLTLVLISTAPLLSPRVYAQDKSLVWEQFNVEIEVQPDGSFDVAEHQTIRFTSGSFSVGYRDLPIRNFRYADNWAITDGQGNVYRQTQSGEATYTFTVTERGGSYIIEWFFPSMANRAETFTLSYTVYDGLRFYEGGDQLWWKAIYADRSFPVLNGQVRVAVPEGATIQQWSAYINDVNARGSANAELVGSQALVYTLQSRLQAGEDFEVRVEFTPNIVDGAAQPWQAAADAEAEQRAADQAFRDRWGSIATLGLCALGLLLTFGGPAALYGLWYRIGRDKPVDMVAEYLPEPPTPVAPGMAGTLLDEQVDMEDIVATLVDLARRKVISITEDSEQSFLHMRHDFIYRREDSDVPLLDYEQKLLNALFGTKDEVRLSKLKNKFYTKIDGIKKAMYAEVVQLGFFPSNPEATRNQFGCLGVGGILVAIGVGVVLMGFFGNLTAFGFAPGVGLAVTAVALIAFARYMPRKTDRGSEEAARWKAFRTYLRDIDKYSDLEAQKEIWDRYLPYAIAFGIEKEYIRKFEAIDAPAPGWYIPRPDLYGPYRRRYYGIPGTGPVVTAGGGMPEMGGPGGGLSDMSRGMGSSLTAMSAGLGAMLSSASSTMTSRPASSSSGGGWSGGGGFSGGGSFGGGGGGGGGGGFR
jgi:hypothetical protein